MTSGMRMARQAGLALALIGAVLISHPGPVRGGSTEDESAIRGIIRDEIVPGILRESPDLFLRSYLPMATVFSFAKGAVDVAQYHAILEDYFRDANPKELNYEILSLRVTDNTARMAVSFLEKGKRTDGSDYGEGYKRYYVLVKLGGMWKIRVDGYNESLVEIESFHGRMKRSH